MSLIESMKRLLSTSDHLSIAYNIILGSILSGIIVSFSQTFFINDFPNIIELIIGAWFLFYNKSKPLLRSLGYVLTTDGFSSLIIEKPHSEINESSEQKKSYQFKPISSYYVPLPPIPDPSHKRYLLLIFLFIIIFAFLFSNKV